MADLDLLICTLQYENDILRKNLHKARSELRRLEQDSEQRLQRLLRTNGEIARLREQLHISQVPNDVVLHIADET
jgi:hypothetical protein